MAAKNIADKEPMIVKTPAIVRTIAEEQIPHLLAFIPPQAPSPPPTAQRMPPISMGQDMYKRAESTASRSAESTFILSSVPQVDVGMLEVMRTMPIMMTARLQTRAPPEIPPRTFVLQPMMVTSVGRGSKTVQRKA